MARHNQSTNRRRQREQASKRSRDQHHEHVPAALSGLDLMTRYTHAADRDREVWR